MFKQKKEMNYKEWDTYDQYRNAYIQYEGHPLKIVLSFYKGNVWAMLKACFCLFLQRSPVWVIPIVTANIIDIATNGEPHGGRRLLVNILVVSIFLIQNVFSSYLATIYYAKINRHIEGALRNALVRKLQQLSMVFHKEAKSGRLQSKVMRDVENVYELLNQIIRTVFFFILDVSIAIAITARTSPVVLAFFLIVIPISVFTVYQFRKPVKSSNSEFRNDMEQTQGAVAQMLEMLPVTRAHGLQNLEISRMTKFSDQIVYRGYQLDLVNSLFGAVSWVLFQLFQVLCLAFTGYLAYKGKITVGEVVLYQTYFTQIVGQISTIINIYPSLCKGLESVRSIGDILNETNIEKNNSIIPLQDLKGRVDFCNIDFKYRDSDQWILKDFSLQVKSGESVAFVGESGTGKSTILNLLIGFLPVTNGKILIDGINMDNLNMDEYRSQIAMVPQNTILFAGSIRENITYGLNNVSDEAIKQIIHQVGLEDMLEKMPDGLDTQLGEHGDKLSGGQRQRISIARALIRNPKIIIFDEATSALDSVAEKKVQEATNAMMKNCTTFLVAHRLSTIKNADRIVLIKEGKIEEIGTYDELIAKKGNFYRFKSVQE